MKPIICPSCVQNITNPITTFQTKLFETLSRLSTQTVILGQEIKIKTDRFSRQINSIVQKNLKEMKIQSKLQKISKFIHDRKQWIQQEFDPKVLVQLDME